MALAYFSDRAKHINEIVKKGDPDEAKEVGLVLGFGSADKGGTSAGKRARNLARNWAITFKMEEEINSGAGIDAATMVASEAFGVSGPTAYTAHDEFGARARDHLAAKRAGTCLRLSSLSAKSRFS